MSQYVILDNSTQVDQTGGFSRTYGGTGSSSNPSLTYTSYLYQWYARFNNKYNAPSSHDTPNIFLTNTKLLSKYKTIIVSYYRYQYSERSYGYQGIYCNFYDANDNNLGSVFSSYVQQSGGTSDSGTVEVAIPDGATKVIFSVAANNDRSSSYTTCQVSKIILNHRKGAKLGTKDCEVYKGATEITDIYLGNKEIG